MQLEDVLSPRASSYRGYAAGESRGKPSSKESTGQGAALAALTDMNDEERKRRTTLLNDSAASEDGRGGVP